MSHLKLSHCSWPVICREAKRQKLEELSQQLHVLENDIELVQLRSDAVGCLCCALWPFMVSNPSWIPEVCMSEQTTAAADVSFMLWQVPEDSDELTEDLVLPNPATLLQNRLRELSGQPLSSAPGQQSFWLQLHATRRCVWRPVRWYCGVSHPLLLLCSSPERLVASRTAAPAASVAARGAIDAASACNSASDCRQRSPQGAPRAA